MGELVYSAINLPEHGGCRRQPTPPVLFLTDIIDPLKRPFVNLPEARALMGLKFDSGHKMLLDKNKVRLVQPLAIRI